MKLEFREKLAQQSFEEKIRKVGELIDLSRKVKAPSDNALLARLDRAAGQLDAGKGIPIERAREDIKTLAKHPDK